MPNFDTIQQADVEAASKLRDIAFATTDQNAQKQKLLLEDEIEYEKIKTDTLIEQTQRRLDHKNELLEIENARVKAENDTALLKERMENEAALLKVWHDTERIKRKADVAMELKLKFAKWDVKKKVIELEVKHSIV